jgi:SNF2 family DNA or RNA helicase
MLVIAPLRPALLVWPAEARKWADFAHLRVEVLHGPDKDAALARDADVYIINPDGLDWLLSSKKVPGLHGRTNVTTDVAAFRAHGFDTLVIDELTMFKKPTTQRFRTIRTVLDTFSRRWGLTGSPAPNGLLDLFGQIYCLDRGAALGQYITHYRKKYFLPAYNGYDWSLRAGADEEIYERLRPLVLRLEASDYVDMPDLIENVIRFDLPSDARYVYDVLKRDAVVRVGKHLITAANAAVASGKLRQVAAGGLYLEPDVEKLFKEKPLRAKAGRDYAHLHDGKVNALEDLIDELQGQPLLVAYDFNHDLARIRERLGDDVPVIGGGTSTKRAAELERAWNAGELPVLLGHPASIGHGLNLQKSGNQICWFTPTWNLELHQQFINRIQRQGAVHDKVFVHYLIANHTIDEQILRALDGKARVQDLLLEAMSDD